MKKCIRILGLLLAVCLLLSTAAFAAETNTQVIQELDASITIPADWEVYDRTAVKKLFEENQGLELLETILEGFGEENGLFSSTVMDSLYLLAGEFPDAEAQGQQAMFLCEVTAIDQQDVFDQFSGDEMAFTPYDFRFMTDEELEDLADTLNWVYSNTADTLSGTDEAFGVKLEMGCKLYRNEQTAFLAVSIAMETEDLQAEIVLYTTYQAGIAYEIIFASVGTPFTDDHLSAIQSVMDSVRLNQSTYSPSGFVDVKGHWAEESITKAKTLGLFSGVTETTFGPNDGMTRAMLVQVLYRLAGEPESAPSQFTDVAENAWYAKAVAWAAENGIVEGDEGKFRPGDLVKRQELAAILHRYDAGEAEAAEDALNGFTDAETVALWAQTPMAWAVEQGLLNGSDGQLLPAKTATRAEVAAILVRYLEAS